MSEITNQWVADRAAQCDGKVKHQTKARAKAEIRKLGLARKLRVYRCPHCGLFHSGRRP